MNLYVVLVYANRYKPQPITFDLPSPSRPTTINVELPAINIKHTFVVASSKEEAQAKALQQAPGLFAESGNPWGNFEAVATELPQTMELDGHQVVWQLNTP